MSFGIYNQVIAEAVVLLVLCVAAAVLLRGRVQWSWLIGAVAFFGVTKLVLFLGVAGDIYPDILGGRYNWEGKIAAVATTLAVAALIFRGKWAEWGFTWKQNGPAVGLGYVVTVVFILANAAFVYWYWPGVKVEPVIDMAYQMTMPSLDEELVYRGVLLLMLDRAFKPQIHILGAPFGFGALISVALFYVTHALRVDADWDVVFIAFEILPLIYAVFWTYIRAATGSLLLPVLMHSWANGAGYWI